MATPPEANDFPLGNPRSPLRHQLDAHAHAVLHQHSLWVEDDRPSPLTGRRNSHFSRDNFFELAPYAGLLLSPESIFTASLIDPRLRRVLKAIAASYDAAGRLLGWETDQTLHAVLLGVLPILGEMAEVAGLGALVGGLVGAVAGFGLGDEITIPGGAIAGIDIALTLFGLYGLAKMLREGGIHLEEFLRLATEASDLAFFAGENQMLHFSYEQDMRDATNLFAAAIGELWYVLLQAIVAYILKRAAELAGPAALESASKLTARSEALQTALKDAQGYTAKLGPAFGKWLDKNFEKIRKSVEDHQRSRQLGDDGGGEPVPNVKPSQPAKTTAAKQEPSAASFGRVPDEITTSSGIPIKPTPGKTTTILGSFQRGSPGNMDDIINNQLQYPKTTDFGPKPGGFNVLNVPDDLYQNPDQFWNEYNKPFLDDAMERGDPIAMASTPTDDVLFRGQSQTLTGLGREMQYLELNGYQYDETTNSMVKN